MKIGNIVIKEEIDFNYLDFFNIVKDYNSIDKNLPTLIVGIDLVKSIIGRDPDDYVERKLNDMLFWTFDESDIMTMFYEDLFNFLVYCVSFLKKNVKYEYVDFVNYRYSQYKSLINKIKSNKIKKLVHLKDKRLYVLLKNEIYGIDLFTLDFFGFSKENIIKFLKENSENFVEVDIIDKKKMEVIKDVYLISKFL
jgi:hypothetical protein